MRAGDEDYIEKLIERDTPPTCDECRGMHMPDFHNLLVKWLERRLEKAVEKMRKDLGLK